jgi:hypothetical protein
VQKDTARYLVEEKKADYLFTAVKDNQPGLFATLDALDWENTPVTHTARDRGHGRDETRTLQVLPAPEGLFPYAAQAFLIERTVRDPHDSRLRSAAAALGITSRTASRGGTPDAIAAAARAHRDIEALHHGHHHERRCPATPRRHIRPGHRRRPQRRHRHPPPCRVHRHRARPALGRPKPRKAHRSPASHITRMTEALTPVPAAGSRATGFGSANAVVLSVLIPVKTNRRAVLCACRADLMNCEATAIRRFTWEGYPCGGLELSGIAGRPRTVRSAAGSPDG